MISGEAKVERLDREPGADGVGRPTFELPGMQPELRSGIPMLRVRAERNVSLLPRHRVAREIDV